MRKFIAIIIFFAVMFSDFIIAFANSGPTFWRGYPSSDIMSIDPDSKISVKGENLVFDFSHSDYSYYTISGKVTADYDMVNTTSEKKSVQMAFPFVGKLDSLSREDINITADGSSLPYDIYLGDVVNSHGNPFIEDRAADYDFSTIVGGITNESYKGKNFSGNEMGKLYTIEMTPKVEKGVNLAVDFNLNHEKTKILAYGFNGYERNDKKARITAWCYKPEVLKVFVLGEDIEFNINGYIDGELKKKTDRFTYNISTDELNFKDYLMEYVKKHTNIKNGGLVSKTQLYNLYAKALDKFLTANQGYCSEYDLIGQENYERIMTLVYTVEFPPNSEREISISYRASGTMDKTKTKEPLYTFDYILNPAKNWSDFKNLNIKIIPPSTAPYIVDSSIEFEKNENAYTAALDNLPDGDLSFTLYKNEKVTLKDKFQGSLKSNFGYFAPIIKGITIILIVIGTIITIVAVRRKK